MGSYVEQDLAWADRAPIVVEATGTVAGTAQEVWDAIVDYPRWAAWFPQIARCHATSEPSTGLGSTRDVRLKGGGGTIGERFIAWDEPRVWAFTATSGPPVFTSIVERVTIERVGDDRASVTYRMALAPRRALLPVLRLAKGRLASVLATALANLDGEVARRRAG
ncbi:MAG: SRPBCC family protein [Acidimicrobiales bacterium]